METKYILPATIAASLHLIALFGFNRSGVPVLHPQPAPVTPLPNIPVTISDPPEPEEPVYGETQPKGEPEAFHPGLDEPESKIADVTMPMPPATPQPVTITAKIVAGVPGIPNGRDGPWSDRPVLDIGALDNAPRTRSQVAPSYPAELKAAAITGEVVVGFTVDESGRVSHAHIVRSSDPRFETSTLRAVERWRFEPGKKSGRPVRFRMEVPVVFSLNE